MIWEANHTVTKSSVAIKVITSDAGRALGSRTLKFRKMFRSEVRATARLNHRNVVNVLDYGSLPDSIAPLDGLSPGALYYVMPMAEGGALTEYRPHSWAALHSLLTQILEGLAHAHARRVIHRDIKPANILVHGANNPRFIITDFGISFAADPNRWTFDSSVGRGSASGTPHFMAPEQFAADSRRFGPWTDLYGVGIMGYQLATGGLPFQGGSVSDLGLAHINNPMPGIHSACRFAVPVGLESWIWRMTAKSPNDRYRHAADALVDLRMLENAELDMTMTSATSSDDEISAMDTQVNDQVVETLERDPPARLRLPSKRAFSKDWRAIEPSGTPDPMPGVGLGLFGLRQIPMVGRQDQRTALWTALEQAITQNTSQVVVLTGMPGTGKSALMDWICYLASEVGVADVLRDGSRSVQQRDQGLSGLLGPHFRTEGASRQQIEQIVEDELARLGGLSSQLTRILTAILSEGRSSQSQIPASQALESVERFVELLADRRPVVIAIDDGHYNADGVELVSHLAGKDGHPILAIVCETTGHPSTSLDRLKSAEDVRVIAVDPLKPDELSTMLASICSLPLEKQRLVGEKSEGSPLFAVQLVTDWVKKGVLEARGEKIVAVGPIPPLPNSIRDVWSRRLKDLQPDALSALKLIATFGKNSRISHLQGVFEQAQRELDEDLIDSAIREGLLRHSDQGIEFVHGLLQDCVLEMCSDDERLEFNAICAQFLAQRPLATPSDHMRIARHLTLAQQQVSASDHMLTACLGARRAFDVENLRDWTTEWMVVLEQNPDDASWAQALSMQSYTYLLGTGESDRSKAVELARRAIDHANRSGDADAIVAARARRALTTLYSGQVDDGLEILKDLPSANPNLMAEALVTEARLESVRRNLEVVLVRAKEAEEIATDMGLLIQAKQIRARVYLEQDALTEANAHIVAAASLAMEHEYLIAEARSYQTMAFIADASGDFEEAERAHRKALSLFELATPRTAYPQNEREYVARALLAQRRFVEARLEFQKLEELAALGHVGFRQNIYDGLLACAAGLGDWSLFDSTIENATTYDFAPSNLNIRALEIALEYVQDDPRRQAIQSCLDRHSAA